MVEGNGDGTGIGTPPPVDGEKPHTSGKPGRAAKKAAGTPLHKSVAHEPTVTEPAATPQEETPSEPLHESDPHPAITFSPEETEALLSIVRDAEIESHQFRFYRRRTDPPGRKDDQTSRATAKISGAEPGTLDTLIEKLRDRGFNISSPTQLILTAIEQGLDPHAVLDSIAEGDTPEQRTASVQQKLSTLTNPKGQHTPRIIQIMEELCKKNGRYSKRETLIERLSIAPRTLDRFLNEVATILTTKDKSHSAAIYAAAKKLGILDEQQLIEIMNRPLTEENPLLPALSPRERAFLLKIASGFESKEAIKIVDPNNTNPNAGRGTLDTLRKKFRDKGFNVTSTTQLVLVALEQGYLDPHAVLDSIAEGNTPEQRTASIQQKLSALTNPDNPDSYSFIRMMEGLCEENGRYSNNNELSKRLISAPRIIDKFLNRIATILTTKDKSHSAAIWASAKMVGLVE